MTAGVTVGMSGYLRMVRDWLYDAGRKHVQAESNFMLAVLDALVGLCTLWLLLTLCMGCGMAHGAEIPRGAAIHRATLVKSAHAFWGLDAPVATFAAQVQAESWWNPKDKSAVGAQGLAQFMPATAKWLPQVVPAVGNADPWNPAWSLRALVAYDKWLWDRAVAVNDCERMAFTLSAYNGGEGWVKRDKALAKRKGLDTMRWWGNVATVNAGRSKGNWKENRDYPDRILLNFEPLYERAAWGTGMCP